MVNKANSKTWLVLVFLMGIYCTTGMAATIYVDTDAPGPTYDGSSWATAFEYLQDALAVAQNGNDILVAEGTYSPDANSSVPGGSGSRSATFQLKNGVAIYGGYAGFGTPDPNARDIELYETILSGDLESDDVGDANRTDNSYHIFYHPSGTNLDNTAMLDSVTITGGNTDTDDSGGGMYNYDSSPTLTNCTFRENTATGTLSYGGGMYNYSNSSHPTLTNCTFIGNSAGLRGGGICNYSYASPTLTNCTFIRNSVDNYGGGMSNYSYASPTLTNCTFIENSAFRGGGVYSYDDCILTLTNCILWDNTADSGPQLYKNYSCTLYVTYSCIQGGYSGTGNIDIDPNFADPCNNDYHLKSQAGRWNPIAASWIEDDVTSPCIDAGDPDGSIGDELFPDGGRINMGAYGGTTKASKSYFGGPVCEKNIAGDINGDCVIDFRDFAFMASHWLVDNRE